LCNRNASARACDASSLKTDSVVAFTDELEDLEWVWTGGKASLNLNFQFYSAEDDKKTLAVEAGNAVTYVQNALQQTPKPTVAVIVTAGLAATSAVVASLVQTFGPSPPSIPIIQAAGGALPPPVPNINVTGFVLNPLDSLHPFRTCEEQLQRLVSMSPNAMYIAVLYDSTNGYSTTGALAALQALAPTLNPPPNIVPIDTSGNLGNFTVTSLQNNPHPCTGFMLLPNAQFYENRQSIADVVEDNHSPVTFSIYPEREYKKAHSNRTNKYVHGHHIPMTFRRAALYVDSLLDGTIAIPTLAPQEGIIDED
jgi:hypothetical protein